MTEIARKFEKALLEAGYSPNSVRSAVSAADPDNNPSPWAKALFDNWQALGKVPLRRGSQARMARRLMSAGASAVEAHNLASSWRSWQRGVAEVDEEQSDRIRELLQQQDLFAEAEENEFADLLSMLDLSTRAAATILGVSKETVRTWASGVTAAPAWAADILRDGADPDTF